MRQTRFKIEGMRCETCAHAIKTLIEKEPGVQSADVSFEEGAARILFDSRTTSEDRLAARIEKPGYRVVGRE